MGLFEKILGPKSKYDKSIPYTYEARIRIIDGSNDSNSYFSDTICGLVEYLHQNGIKPEETQIVEVYQEKELPIDVKFFTTPDHQWLFKPDICRSFEKHYKGHIQKIPARSMTGIAWEAAHDLLAPLGCMGAIANAASGYIHCFCTVESPKKSVDNPCLIFPYSIPKACNEKYYG